MPRNTPPKRVNLMADFMKQTTQYWPQIEAQLRTLAISPVAALEAEKSRRLGMHHNEHLANAFLQAKQAAELDEAHVKHQTKRGRRIGAGFL